MMKWFELIYDGLLVEVLKGKFKNQCGYVHIDNFRNRIVISFANGNKTYFKTVSGLKILKDGHKDKYLRRYDAMQQALVDYSLIEAILKKYGIMYESINGMYYLLHQFNEEVFSEFELRLPDRWYLKFEEKSIVKLVFKEGYESKEWDQR